MNNDAFNSGDAKGAFRGARETEFGNAKWEPLSAAEVAQDLKRSHPHYVVHRLMGHGGMGAVYQGEDNARPIAIKVLRPDALGDRDYVRSFDREISILRQLEHPNVVRILDAGETKDGLRFFVMELLEGETLAAKLTRDTSIQLREATGILAGICAGTQYVHEHHSLVHRDLKAANIFVTRDGRAVILDFGIAKKVFSDPTTRSRLHGEPGTPGHIAPEVRAGEQSTAASDVFSIGVVLFQMLTGKIPDGWPVLPPEFRRLEPIVQKALAQEPGRRFTSAKELGKAVTVALQPDRASSAEAVVATPANHDGPFSQGELSSDRLKLGTNTLFLRSISSMTLKERDTRTGLEKSIFGLEGRKEESLLQGCFLSTLVSLGWLAAVICLLAAGVEYALSAVNIAGFLSPQTQEAWLGISLFYSLAIPAVALAWAATSWAKRMIWSRANFNYSFGFPRIERSLTIGAAGGKDYVIRSTDIRVAYLKNIIERMAFSAASPAVVKFNLGKGQLWKQDPTDNTHLTEATGVGAIALLNDGRTLVATERYGQDGACLGLYDVETLRRTTQVFVDSSRVPSSIGVLPSKDQYPWSPGQMRVIVDVDRDLRVVDLEDGATFGSPMPMYFHNIGGNEGRPHLWWQAGGSEKELFRTAEIGIFDNGRIAVAHCGIAAPQMPAQLVSWDLDRFELKAGPVFTPDVDTPQMTDDKAGVADVRRRQFITGQRFGRINFWNIDSATLERTIKITTASHCERSTTNCASNQIESMCISADGSRLAVGTYCGAIHLIDVDSGNDIVVPLVPKRFNYADEHDYAARPKEPTAIHFFANDSRLVAGYEDGSLQTWDVKSGTEVGAPIIPYDENRSAIRRIVVIPNSNTVLAVTASCVVQAHRLVG
jgi:serine/threonine protein kinase/WD40 repeat protein